MGKINTVILDIGRVLVEFDWKSYLSRQGFSKEIQEELGNLIFDNPLWKERDRGDKDEEECRLMFIKTAPHLEKEINKVFEDIVNIVEVYPFSKEWVKSIKKRVDKVYLLSNYSKASFENDKKKFDFMEYVDGGVISYEVKAVKPESTIYKKLIDKYGINPKEAVFLDDVEENLDGARKFGMETIHVISHEVAVKELDKLIGC